MDLYLKYKKIVAFVLFLMLLIGCATSYLLPVFASQEKTGQEKRKYANQVTSVKNGTITKQDGSIEYGTPEDGQLYEESHIDTSVENAEFFDRYAYHPSERTPAMMSNSVITDMSAEIRKRTQWVNKWNGDAQITLQYQSNSGSIQGTEDMNIVLVHDKSGSMDVNYGYHIEVIKRNWGSQQNVRWYPSQNTLGWSETVSDIATETKGVYMKRLNYKDASSEYPGFFENWLTNGEMAYNSPCQLQAHYYFVVEHDKLSNIPAWTMVHGNNLQYTLNTDLHHYMQITRDEAVNTYLPKGRRVVRMTQGCYYNENGEKIQVDASAPVYFLDVSQVIQHNGTWILNMCAMAECQKNDRLSKSQEFMNTLVTQIQLLNPDNKIAYVPFWGDVPTNGSWDNASSHNTEGELFPDNENRMTSKEGVSEIGFTTDENLLRNQIDHPFTYDGTNWTRAFQHVQKLLDGRDEADLSKKTLIIFLTDGIPQGTAGKIRDVNNPKINGMNEIAKLQKEKDVTIYACGVGVNQYDTTELVTRLNQADSSGMAVYARQPDDFEQLKTTILTRINNQYCISIEGEEAFYTDQLAEDFELDEAAIDASWKVVPAADATLIKGVPQNVYQAAKAGAKAIYVQNTKTIYWYIGKMKNGTYEEEGHAFSFPIKYKKYQISTENSDHVVVSNKVQKLTYVTTQNANKLRTCSMNAPSILFHRQSKPEITVEKQLTGGRLSKDYTSHFVYSKKWKKSGIVEGIIDRISLTIPAGTATGKAAFKEVAPGEYFLYEVDEQNRIVNPDIKSISITEIPSITTIHKNDVIPTSVVCSDGTTLDNLDNHLKIITKGTAVLFNEMYTHIDVTKKWDGGNESHRPSEIIVHLLRNKQKIQSLKLTAAQNWEGSFTELQAKDANGQMYEYTIEEEPVVGFETEIKKLGDTQYEIVNHVITGNIELMKTRSDQKTPLEGAKFEIADSSGNVISTKTSDRDGKIRFVDLLPDIYTITEIQTGNGYTLLKEPLKVQLPKTMTKKEAETEGIDLHKCKSYPNLDLYLLYDLQYKVTNHGSFELPKTGDEINWKTFAPIGFGFLTFFVSMSILLRRKKKK